MSTYEAQKLTDPRLPFIFHDTYRPNKLHVQPDNWHENIEILYFDKGEADVSLNERHIAVKAGDTVVVNSNCLHSINSSAELHYYCLIIHRSFCLANYFDTNLIVFEELFRDEVIAQKMAALAKEYEKPSAPFHVQLIRSLVLDICAHLCQNHSRPERVPETESHLLSCIKQALGHIHTNYNRNLSLDEIADLVGLSKFYFAREFRRVTGYTLIAYVNLIRCEKAKKLLSENRLSVGAIGEECGFSNQSYFTKIFTAYTGRRPGEYRKSKLISE